MRTSSFEYIVRLQFNSLMLIVIKNKLKSRNRQFARRSKREVLFCEIAETKQVECGTNDTYFYDCISFKVFPDLDFPPSLFELSGTNVHIDM